jgi:hypothetical protein
MVWIEAMDADVGEGIGTSEAADAQVVLRSGGRVGEEKQEERYRLSKA